jgi:hypothetical protein
VEAPDRNLAGTRKRVLLERHHGGKEACITQSRTPAERVPR